MNGLKGLYKVGNDTYAVTCMEKLIKLAKEQTGEKNHSVFYGIEYIIEDLINKINTPGNSSIYNGFEEHYLDRVMDFIGFIMDKHPNAITEFGFISHLYQFIQKEEKESSLTDKLKQFFDNRVHKEEADIGVFEPYKEKLDNFTKMSEDEFNSFLNTALDYRNKTGMFPENVCDYIIKRLLIYKGNPESGISDDIKMRVIEDKAGYLAREKGYNNTIIVSSKVSDQFIERDSISGKCTHLGGLIRLRASNCLEWFKITKYENTGRKSINILNCLFHEMRHMIQPEQREQFYYDPTIYKMFKEDILRVWLNGYEGNNYTPEFIESDARIYADIDLIQYLKKLKFTKEELREAGLSDFEEIVESNVLEELSDESSEQRYDPDSKGKRNFEDIFQDFIKREYIFIHSVSYSILKYEYDYDTGERKRDMELLEEYQELELSEKLYPTIIKDGATVTNEKMLENIGKILTFIPKYPETERLRDYILREKILPRVKDWTEKGKVDLKPIDGLSKEDMDEIEKGKLEYAILCLIQFVESHPDFSKDPDFLTILESDVGIIFSADDFLKSYNYDDEDLVASVSEAASVLDHIIEEKNLDGKEEEKNE